MHIDYGHMRATSSGVNYDFYPSLENVVKIGSPEQIIITANEVNMTEFWSWFDSASYHDEWLSNKIHDKCTNKALIAAKRVLESCCDISIVGLIGDFDLDQDKIHVKKAGAIKDRNEIILIAKHLITHGIVGKSNNKEPDSDSKPVTEFNAAEYVSMARRHLGMSRDEAWSCTMTELVKEMEALNLESKKDNKEISDQEYDDIMKIVNRSVENG